MCRSLADRLGFVNYQVEDHGYPNRLVCTLDHVATISNWKKKYDIIILDEGGMTRSHSLSTTISDRLSIVLQNLTRLLMVADKVIITQHEVCSAGTDVLPRPPVLASLLLRQRPPAPASLQHLPRPPVPASLLLNTLM